LNRQTQKLAKEVNVLVKEYVEIERDIFKPSLRKSLPIPGFFRPVDYKSHYGRLGQVLEELEKIKKEISSLRPESQSLEGRFLITLRSYVTGLANALVQLKTMCLHLDERSEGGSYSKGEYREEARKLRELERKYFETGKKLNELLAEIKGKK
jgi:predicted RNase H-like nuclease (RuvC/YqgF family)